MTDEKVLRWAEVMRPAWDHDAERSAVPMHRKIWEWAFTLHVLDQQGLLRPGSRGLGFGVGQDPLSAVLASRGCEIVATDMDPDRAAARGWLESGEYAGTAERLNTAGLCDPDDFAKRVTFEIVDMNRIPDHLRGFDFTWSSCAFEHLGSIARGQEFILRQMQCLRPGGIAVHTTEYNVFSNGPTVSTGETVLFRKRDIEWLVDELRSEGHRVEVDFDTGSGLADRHVDMPPWQGPHLKLRIGEHVSTSLALIVEAGTMPPRRIKSWQRATRRHLALERPRILPMFDALVGLAVRYRSRGS